MGMARIWSVRISVRWEIVFSSDRRQKYSIMGSIRQRINRRLTTEKMHDGSGLVQFDGSKMLTLAAISAFNEKDAFKVRMEHR